MIVKDISRYVEYELNIFRKECNFSNEELEYFNCKAKNMTIVEICLTMNISQTKMYSISNKVAEKMEKVEKLFSMTK